MSIQPSRTEYLFQKMLLGECSPGELEELHALLNGKDAEEELEGPMKAVWDTMAVYPENVPSDKMYRHIREITKPKPVHSLHWWWAAASLALLLGLGGYFLFQPGKRAQPLVTAPMSATDVGPGRNGAVLTLADGSQLVLDSIGDGEVATQNGTRAVMRNGQLAYTDAGNENGEITYNTINIPRGRQFLVQLPDGTKIWLNSASSITYPTTFSDGERKVKISGEAYLEVAKNAEQPFVVQAGGSEIQVLGTGFNVNAYDDEPAVTTTLAEGAVKVKTATAEQLLAPGEQAIQRQDGSLYKEKTDVAQVTAWKRGLFSFENKSMAEVLRELARWYDLEIVYGQRLPDIRFGGEIEKNLNLSQIMNVLEKAGLRFKLEEGRKLVVYP